MAASIVEICNMALYKVGNLSIASLEDETKEARACKVFWPLVRNEMLQAHPWNFAMARADISAELIPSPAFEWEYAYTLPADCLRVWELWGTEDEWIVEGNSLLTNKAEEIYIRYIKRLETSARYSPAFDVCLATRLGAELAGKLVNDRNLQLSLFDQLYKIHLPAAITLNAQEGRRPRSKREQPLDKGNFSWQREGH